MPLLASYHAFSATVHLYCTSIQYVIRFVCISATKKDIVKRCQIKYPWQGLHQYVVYMVHATAECVQYTHCANTVYVTSDNILNVENLNKRFQ